jgi:hypothetical protein
MTTGDDDQWDLSKRFPADARIWGLKSSLSLTQAALLSLGIEPTTIEELAEQREEGESNRLGFQDAEYERRLACLQRAVKIGDLSATRDQRNLVCISRMDFIAWARTNTWSLPEPTPGHCQMGWTLSIRPRRSAARPAPLPRP